MRRLLYVATLLGSSAFGCSDALAAARPLKVENWTGAAYVNEQSKQFERCSATAKAANGAAISYSIDRNLHWTLAISNESWSLYRGLALAVWLKFDARMMQGRGAGIGKDGFEVQVEDDIALFSSLRTSLRMQAIVGGSKLDFDLTNSDLALSTLAQCALRQTGLIRQTSKATPKKMTVVASGSNKVLNDEAAAAARDISEYARLGGFRLLGPTEPLFGAGGAAAWKADVAAGAVFVVTANEAGALEQVSNRIVEHGARACRGEYFFATANDLVDQTKVVRVYDACKMPDATAITYYIAVPRAAGGYYVITTTAGAGFAITLQQEAEAVDAKIRAVVTVALRKAEHDSAREQTAAPPDENAPPQQ